MDQLFAIGIHPFAGYIRLFANQVSFLQAIVTKIKFDVERLFGNKNVIVGSKILEQKVISKIFV